MTDSGNGPSAPEQPSVSTMTETGNGTTAPKPKDPKRRRKGRVCFAVTGIVLLTLAIIILILAFTVFKTRDPKTTLVSASVTGVSPRVSLPAVRIELNVTLNLVLRVKNPNLASFRHAAGTTLVFYRGTRVGEADVSPGRIPSKGSEDIRSRMTVEADKFGGEILELIGDVLAGEVGIDTWTRIPGRVTILGIFKRHAVTLVECHVAIGFPNLKIRRQDCKHRTKM